MVMVNSVNLLLLPIYLGILTSIEASHVQYECPGADWADNGRYCYIFHPEDINFAASESQCNQDGAYLASVHSSEEDLYILQLVKSSPDADDYYIGLENVVSGIANSGSWTDGTPRDYNNWRQQSSEPNTGGGSCVVINEDRASKWRDDPCSYVWASVCKYDKECGGQVDTNSFSTPLLPTPGAGVQYHRHAHVTWYFEAPTGSCLQLQLTSIEVQCDFDYIQLYNGRQSDSPALTDKLCGPAISSTPIYYSTGTFATLVFVTDGAGTAAGFEMVHLYRNCGSLSTDICDTIIPFNFNFGAIYSHARPGYYADRMECLWLLNTSNAIPSVVGSGTVALEFMSMDLQSHPNCIHDYLEIRHGADESGDLIGRYCGSTLPERLVLPGPFLWLQFVTDESIERPGFEAAYSYHNCGGSSRVSGGTVSSDGYPSAYAAGQSCAWKIEAPYGSQIEVSFNAGFHLDCANNDSLEFFDGGPLRSSSTSLGGLHCGTTVPAGFTSQTNHLLAVFISGGGQQLPGELSFAASRRRRQTGNIGFEFSYTFVTGNLPCKTTSEMESATVRFPFDALNGDTFDDGTYRVSPRRGTPTLVQGIVGNAVYLDGTVVLTLGQRQATCFFDLGECLNGATLAMWLQYRRSLDGDLEMFQILSNGGQTGESYGWSVFLDPDSNGAGLMVDLSTKTQSATLVDFSWSTDVADIEAKWVHVAITFDNTGIYLYKDGKFVRYAQLLPRQNSITSATYNEFVFGVPNDQLTTDYYSGGGYIDELLFWDSAKDPEFITVLFESYNDDRETCSPPYECVDGSCVCPTEGLDCNATVTFTSDRPTSEPVLELSEVDFTCTTDATEPFQLALMYDANDGGVAVAMTMLEVVPANQIQFTTSVTLTRSEDGSRFFCRASDPGDATSYRDSTASFIYTVEYGPDNVVFTSDTPSNESQPVDTVVTLTCTVEANPPPLLSIWRTSSVNSIDNTAVGSDAAGGADAEADVKVAEQTTPGLSFSTQVVLRRHIADEEFYCLVAHAAVTVLSDEKLSYTVTYPADAVEIAGSPSPNVPIQENQDTLITCTADASPASNLSITVTDSLGVNVLAVYWEVTTAMTVRLALTREYDQATIMCRTEPEGLESEALKYTVIYNPSEVSLTADVSDGSLVAEGTAVTFNCSLEARPAPVLSLWFYDGRTEQKADFRTFTDHQLAVTFTLQREHSGVEFYCLAELSAPEYRLTSNGMSYRVEYNATQVIITSDRPTGATVQEDALVALTCTTDRHPPGELSLIHTTTGQVISSNRDNELTVSLRLDRTYHGSLLQCRVADDDYSMLSSGGYQYYVEFLPSEVSMSVTPSKTTTVSEGTLVTLTCTTDEHNPPQSISWFLDDGGEAAAAAPEAENAKEDLVRGNSNGWVATSKLTVTAATSLDNATFMCRVGKVSDSYTLHVDELEELPPSIDKLTLGLGVAGAVVGLGAVLGIVAAIIMKVGGASPASSGGKGLLQQQTYQNPNYSDSRRPYIPRGYRSRPPTYDFYKQRF